MSKSKEMMHKPYTLKTFSNPETWSGQPLHKDACHKLQVGDIVRLFLMFGDSKGVFIWGKYYFQITKVDHYRYGSTDKIRKFHGTVMDIYCPNWDNIPKDHKISWRREHIMEIPGWSLPSVNIQHNRQQVLEHKG